MIQCFKLETFIEKGKKWRKHFMFLFEKNVYALETSKIFSDEINRIIVMGLL